MGYYPQESLYKPYKYHGYTVRGTPNCPLILPEIFSPHGVAIRKSVQVSRIPREKSIESKLHRHRIKPPKESGFCFQKIWVLNQKYGKTPQIIHLFIGFSIIFTIHFGVPLSLETSIWTFFFVGGHLLKDKYCSCTNMMNKSMVS